MSVLSDFWPWLPLGDWHCVEVWSDGVAVQVWANGERMPEMRPHRLLPNPTTRGNP